MLTVQGSEVLDFVAQGVCMRSNLIPFVLVLVLVIVNRYCVEDEGRGRKRTL